MRYDLFIGLQDWELDDEASREGSINRIIGYLRDHEIPFSTSDHAGGYAKDESCFIKDQSLRLRLIDAEEDAVRRLAQGIRDELKQDSVLVVAKEIEMCYV